MDRIPERKELFKNPESYTGLSVEYPPKPALGHIEPKDIMIKKENGAEPSEKEYAEHLYRFIEKRYGLKSEDVFSRKLPSGGNSRYPESFYLELAIYFLDKIPSRQALSFFDVEKYPDLGERMIIQYTTMFMSRTAKRSVSYTHLTLPTTPYV